MKFDFLNQHNSQSDNHDYSCESYSLDKIRRLKKEISSLESQIRYLENTGQDVKDFASKLIDQNMDLIPCIYKSTQTMKDIIVDVYYHLFLMLDPKIV